MEKMPIVNLLEQTRQLSESGQRVRVLWQHPDTLVFIARGPGVPQRVSHQSE